MFNAESLIHACIKPLQAMLDEGLICEIIVVNDGSTDAGATLVEQMTEVRLCHTNKQSGPGAARNLGATHAKGDYLWFVDADVVLADDAGRVLQTFLLSLSSNDGIKAVIGSYDTQPQAQNFLSQYKNLVHHYYHQNAADAASTFWSGCGVIERTAFAGVEGFDVDRFPYPSCEDIDLGYRLRDEGVQIRLLKTLQGKHLKEWRFVNLLYTEVFRRALPWSTLMLERNGLSNDLNVGKVERLRAIAVFVTLACCIAVAFGAFSPLLVAGCLGVLVIANWRFITFFYRQKGIAFTIGAFAYHQFYYVYSTLAFAWAWFAFQFRGASSTA
jgi:glycosyltransferase involved in cell wall biosynthesis